MPIYEFICQECGNEFERLQSFSDTSAPLCPSCQSVQVRRRLSPPAIHFKGSGWYVTDSKNGAKNGKTSTGTAAKEGETTGAAAAATDAGKSDAGKSDAGKSDSGKSDAGEGVKTESTPKSEGATSTVKESA
jgi:putative FmdB family regulatory protein